MFKSLRPHRRQPIRLLCPWDSPGKYTGVGCHFLLQCIHACSVTSAVSDSCQPYGQQSTRLFCPRDSLDKNTEVGCHFPLQFGAWTPIYQSRLQKDISQLLTLKSWVIVPPLIRSLNHASYHYWPMLRVCMSHLLSLHFGACISSGLNLSLEYSPITTDPWSGMQDLECVRHATTIEHMGHIS